MVCILRTDNRCVQTLLTERKAHHESHPAMPSSGLSSFAPLHRGVEYLEDGEDSGIYLLNYVGKYA
jgi:hypothetical protein